MHNGREPRNSASPVLAQPSYISGDKEAGDRFSPRVGERGTSPDKPCRETIRVGEEAMKVSRRQALRGTAASAAALATGVFRPAIAQSEPIRIGYLPALTGPSSSTGIGINRGTELAVKEINAAGGIKGRQIELIVRDTQSDPTKAVNGATELTRRHKVQVMWGPLNSGEALAATPLIARDGVPQIHPCWVDALTDPKKYPLAFRNAPTNQQIGGAANHYVVNILKVKKVAVVSDTTG